MAKVVQSYRGGTLEEAIDLALNDPDYFDQIFVVAGAKNLAEAKLLEAAKKKPKG